MTSEATSTFLFPSATHRLPFHLRNYIESVRDELKPPVGNKMIYGMGCQLKIMVVGGPNIRTDYHINQGEEWFYQLKGDMCLKIVKDGIFQDVVIREGDQFILPGNIPHSPQRLPNTLGLVIERQRHDELDGLRWYCQNCHAIVYEEFFHCEDLGSQLKVKINAYYGSEEMRTCKSCKTVDRVPNVDASAMKSVTDILRVTRPRETDDGELSKLLPERNDSSSKILSSGVSVNSTDPQSSFPSDVAYPPAFSLNQWIETILQSDDVTRTKGATAFGESVFEKKGVTSQGEFHVRLEVGPNNHAQNPHKIEHEVFHYQLVGDLVLHVMEDVNTNSSKEVIVKEGECVLLPVNTTYSASRPAGSYGLVIKNRAA